MDYPAVAGKLADRGFQAGKLDEAITRLGRIDSRHLEALSPDEQARLAAWLANVWNSGQVRQFVNALEETSDVRGVLDEDVPETERMSRLWANKRKVKGGIGNLRYRHVDRELEASDFVHVARQVELKKTQLIVKRGGKLHFLQRGTLEEGWKHIEARHIEGSYKLDAKDSTTFFPVGRTVKGSPLPDTMTKGEVKDMLYDAIKKGDPSPQGQKTKYYFGPEQNGYPDSGITDMRVIVKADRTIETAYPLSGEAVKRWVPELGDLVDTE